jgi:hypothetical protein
MPTLREKLRVLVDDFALLISHPKIDCEERRSFKPVDIESHGSKCGLLSQAKLKRHKRKWGKIKANQKKRLRGREEYLSLLLYEYSDDSHTCLEKFRWHICKNSSIDDVAEWLQQGRFPKSYGVSDVLWKLARGEIGTKNREIIDDIILPKASQVITVWIDWPDDSRNPDALVETIKSLVLKKRQDIDDGDDGVHVRVTR